jgi:hypothetical protein
VKETQLRAFRECGVVPAALQNQLTPRCSAVVAPPPAMMEETAARSDDEEGREQGGMLPVVGAMAAPMERGGETSWDSGSGVMEGEGGGTEWGVEGGMDMEEEAHAAPAALLELLAEAAVASVSVTGGPQHAASMERGAEEGLDGGGAVMDGEGSATEGGGEGGGTAAVMEIDGTAEVGVDERENWEERKHGGAGLIGELVTNPRYRRWIWSVRDAGGAGAGERVGVGASADAGETSGSICSHYKSEGYSAMNQDTTRNRAYEQAIQGAAGWTSSPRVLEVGTGASALLTCMVLRHHSGAHVLRCALIFYCYSYIIYHCLGYCH